MANEVFKKSLSAITAQASAAITAAAFSGGSQTTINQAGSAQNASGAFEAEVYVAVTSAPSGGVATADILALQSQLTSGTIPLAELSADPSDPDEGESVVWQSDGTGSGDDGDILIKITAGGVTKTATLVDFSAV